MENEIEKRPDLEKDPTTEQNLTLTDKEIPKQEKVSDTLGIQLDRVSEKRKKIVDNNKETRA